VHVVTDLAKMPVLPVDQVAVVQVIMQVVAAQVEQAHPAKVMLEVVRPHLVDKTKT
jgi:hypothetical protein